MNEVSALSIQAGAPTSGGAKTDSGALAASARQFEAMALGEFLQPMFSTVDESGDLFGGGQAEAILKPMLVTEFAKLMEQKGGIGLEPLIEQKMGELAGSKDQRR